LFEPPQRTRALKSIGELKHLRELNVYQTKVSVGGLLKLKNLDRLSDSARRPSTRTAARPGEQKMLHVLHLAGASGPHPPLSEDAVVSFKTRFGMSLGKCLQLLANLKNLRALDLTPLP